MTLTQDQIFEVLKKVERPSRYLGGEINSIVKDLSKVDLKVALVMPETYEIGQSNLGLKILYEAVNRLPNVAAERVYAPWVDAEKVFRETKIPPFSLENKIPLHEFDLIGISLPYELSYTNLLTLFDLAGIPFKSKDRGESFPLILGGGNQAFNPEPIAEFFDAFVVGDGEEALVQIVKKMVDWEGRGASDKIDFLRELAQIQGVYIPSFFDVSYHGDGTLSAITPRFPDYPGVKKATVKDLDQAVFPEAPIVPSMKTVHDRLSVEVQRGCVRGCRFCQAGYIYRPERQRSPQKVLDIVERSLPNTGDEQVSLLSLSVGDYGCLVPLVRELFDRYEDQKISISLPATRTDTFSPEVIQEVKRVRMTGFTVAPEAGTPRMRRVINKGNFREDLFKTVDNVFKEGWRLIKFYYMCGLPFEHFEDLEGIIDEGHGALKIGRQYSSQARIHLSVSPHVPKPHTPFQWEAQDSIETTQKKIAFMRGKLKNRGVEFKWHDPYESYLEGVFARGDRRLSAVIEKAWEMGCRFDGWREMFRFDTWEEAFRLCGIDPDFYVARERAREEILPWDHLFIDLKKDFLWEEREAARKEAFMPDCSVAECTFCGICDFHEVLNVNYRVESSPSPPPSPTRGEGERNEIPSPLMGEGQGEGGPAGQVVQFSTRGRRLGTSPPPTPNFNFVRRSPLLQAEGLQEKVFHPNQGGRREGLESSLPKVFSNYRCRFTKTGDIAFLSHLELMSVLKRALSRAKVKMKFSEGYHPQPKLSLSHALPVGVESLSEFFDMEVEGFLDPTPFVERINGLLPRGLDVKACDKLSPGTPSVSSTQIGAVWQVELSKSYPGGKERLEERIRWLRTQTELIVDRPREKGTKRVNISPFIASVTAMTDRSLTVVTRFTPSGSTRPQEVLKCLLEDPEEMLAGARVTKVDSLFTTSNVQ